MKQRGLTLIEVMVSILILSLVMIAVFMSSSHVMKTTSRVQDRTMAVWVGQAVLNDIRMGSWGVVSEQASFSGDMKMGQRTWRWLAQAQPFYGVVRVDVAVFPPGQQEALLTQHSYVLPP